MLFILVKAVNHDTGGLRFGYLLREIETGRERVIHASTLIGGGRKNKGRLFRQISANTYMLVKEGG